MPEPEPEPEPTAAEKTYIPLADKKRKGKSQSYAQHCIELRRASIPTIINIVQFVLTATSFSIFPKTLDVDHSFISQAAE